MNKCWHPVGPTHIKEGLYINCSLNALKGGYRRFYSGLLQGLLRGICGVSTMAHIALHEAVALDDLCGNDDSSG